MLQYSSVVKATPETFWDRLEQASEDVGLPCGLSDIGRELDIWPSAVQKWRDGANLPGQTNLIALAMARGVNTEWLKTGRGQKLAEGQMDAATREFMQLWMNLPAESRERLLSAARYEKNVQALAPHQPDLLPPSPARPPKNGR